MKNRWTHGRGWMLVAQLMLAACGAELVDESSVSLDTVPYTSPGDTPSMVDVVRPYMPGETSAGPAVKPAPVQKPNVARVVVIGDSISVGWGATNGDLGYASLLYKNDDAQYPAFANRDLLHRFNGALTWISVAHAGDQAHHVVQQQLPRLTNPEDSAYLGGEPVHGHTVVILTVGGNDLKNSFRPHAQDAVLRGIENNLREVMRFFGDKQRFPDGASIYFANVYDISDGEDQFYQCVAGLIAPGMSATVTQWGKAYGRVAQEFGATLIDAHALFSGHGFNHANRNNPYYRIDDPSLWIYERDCIHPNNRGHNALRAAFWRAIDAHPPR